MKHFLLSLLLCAKLHGAAADDAARTFLQGVAAQGVAPVLTNVTPIIKLSTVLLTATNLPGTTGAGVSGLVAFDHNNYTNLNALAQLTNLAGVIIPGGTLAVDGARIHGEWGGKLMDAVASTNRITITLGSTTILDSGLRPWSNSVFLARVLVVYSGPAEQHVEAFLRMGAPGNVSVQETNVNLDLTLDNSISRRLSLNGASRRLGGITNNGARWYYESTVP